MLSLDEEKIFKGHISIQPLNIETAVAELSIKPGYNTLLKCYLPFNILKKQLLDSISELVFVDGTNSIALKGLRQTPLSGHNLDENGNTEFTFEVHYFLLTNVSNFNWKKFSIKSISVNTQNLDMWMCRTPPNRDPVHLSEKLDTICNYKKGCRLHIYNDICNLNNLPISFLNMEIKKGLLSIDETFALINDMELLLCILIGFSSRPQVIRLNKNIYLYISFFKPNTQKPSFWGDFTYDFVALTQDKLFPRIFNNFFKIKESFRKSYHNLLSVLNESQETLPEDKIFRLFVMLDAVTRSKIQDQSYKLSDSIKKKIKEKIFSIIDTYLLQASNIKALSKPTAGILKNNIQMHILDGNRFYYLDKIKKIHENCLSGDAKSIIDFSDELLTLLKDSRNALAHAEKLPEKFYSFRDILFYKTKLFILFLVWRDLGLSEKYIFKAIDASYEALRYYCDRRALDIYLGMKKIRLNKKAFISLGIVQQLTRTDMKESSAAYVVLEKKGRRYAINVPNSKILAKNYHSYTDPKKILEPIYRNTKEITWISDFWAYNNQNYKKVTYAFIVHV